MNALNYLIGFIAMFIGMTGMWENTIRGGDHSVLVCLLLTVYGLYMLIDSTKRVFKSSGHEEHT